MRQVFDREVYVIGDIHGQVNKITADILANDSLRGCAFILLGDIGCGFYGNHLGPIKALHRLGEETDNEFYIFRGNHDCPQSFEGACKEKAEKKFPRVHILNDFDEVVLKNGKTGIIIAGSISVDRNACRRDPITAEVIGRERGKQYWEDELMRYDEMAKIETHYDFVLAHGGPTPFTTSKNTGFIDMLSKYDAKLKDDLAVEQKAVESFIERVKPDYWINGHFHVNEVFEFLNTRIVAVDMETVAALPVGLTH